MMERSLLFDPFWQEFNVGVLATDAIWDQRATWAFMFSKPETFNSNFGASFGDGVFVYTGRLTGLPWYEEQGRCLLHLGASAQYRVADRARTANQTVPTPPPGVSTTQILRYRTRPELRDAGETLGDSTRFVDTGVILGDGATTLGGELFWVQGPFSIQSEYTGSWGQNTVFPASPAGTFRGDPYFWGGYVLCSYFLTGEHRTYDRRFGLYSRVIPNENFFLVKNGDGKTCCGWGAWELLYRYSFVDLNDNGINGGQLTGQTLGLNWYWNPNTKMQVNYVNSMRNVIAPANSGTVHALGVRMHIDW
jgi:phosphate-selective porin OprO/OprP